MASAWPPRPAQGQADEPRARLRIRHSGYTTPVETRTAPLIGGRYRIGGLLGEGGMARVFDAFDERLERPAAVKILRAETRALPGMRKRFQQEALIAARLMHPHIVAVLDFGEDHALSFLVMERLPGKTLRDEVVARGPLPTRRVMLVMAETLAGLQAAHSRGVLHRDIKPSNILLEHDGHTKITDFGIAKSFDIQTDPAALVDDMTITGFVLGTPGYLAPERRLAYPATVQSDVYSVGAVMVETLTGQRLGSGAAPTERLPAAFRDVARRALATDPRDRFTSADEMLHALRNATAGTRAATPRPSPRPPWPDTRTVAVPNRAASGTALFTLPRPARQRGAHARVRRRRLALAAIAVRCSRCAALRAVRDGSAAHRAGDLRRPASRGPPADPGADPPEHDTHDRRSELGDLRAGGIAGEWRVPRRRGPGQRPPGHGRGTARHRSGVLGPGDTLPRRTPARRRRHHVGPISGRRHRPAADRRDRDDDNDPTTAPTQQFQVPFFQGHGHGHGTRDGAGGQG